jgi:hypothetical protein
MVDEGNRQVTLLWRGPAPGRRSGAGVHGGFEGDPASLGDGRVAMNDKAAGHASMAAVLGRKDRPFAGSVAGGEVLTDASTVVGTATLCGFGPEPCLADIPARIRAHDPRHSDESLPQMCRADREADRKTALCQLSRFMTHVPIPGGRWS